MGTKRKSHTFLKRIVFVLCLLNSFFLAVPLSATHIVGGGFNMINEGNYMYRIRLTLYFDAINGSAGAKDQEANFAIYQTVDNHLMQVLTVPLQSDTESIHYEDRSCGTPTSPIQTLVFYYETMVELPPGQYSNQKGYYVAWERCCRNDGISNILNPGEVGQTFVLYFPPVSVNGQPFTNDSPLFAPVPSQIFCINQFSTLNFSATDFDGDSLVFDLVDPIVSNIANTLSPRVDEPGPAPYFPVQWLPDFGTGNQIPGDPGLEINPQTGIMAVKPNQTGLFVFAVRCQEYRNGIKIGEVRREFQQKVIDCPTNTPPTVTVKDPTRVGNLHNNDTLYLSNFSQTPTCVTVKVTDLQVGQVITLKTQPLNFTPIAPISGDTTKLVTSTTDTVRLSFCLPACVGSTKENPWRLLIMAFDNGCSGSLADTLDVYIVLTVPTKLLPALTLEPPHTSYRIGSQDSLKIKVKTEVSDPLINFLSASATDKRNRNVALNSINMRFPSKSGLGTQSSLFEWKAPCTPPFNQPITVLFYTETEFCNQNITVSKPVSVEVMPKAHNPIIYVAGEDSTGRSYHFKGKVKDSKHVQIVGEVGSNSPISIRSLDPTDGMGPNGIQFPMASDSGRVESTLLWNPACTFDQSRFADGLVLVAASTACNLTGTDSLRVFFDLDRSDITVNDPYNFLSPNRDEMNDNFTLASFVGEAECEIPFDGFELFDRWGRHTYKTSDPGFVWPGNEKGKSGVYFYLIKISGRSYTGWLKVVE